MNNLGLSNGLINALSAWITASLLTVGVVSAGEADIVNATVTALGDNRYRIDATVLHADTGWDHYANRWEVLDQDGHLIDTRVLLHPHVNEQPFTRSLTVQLPAGTEIILLRASDSVHGLGGKTLELLIKPVK